MPNDPFTSALLRLSGELKAAHFAKVAQTEKMSDSEKRNHVAKMNLREASVRDAIDEACRLWVKTKAWPGMNADDAVFVWTRLYEAWLFGGLLRKKGFSSSAMTEEDILLFFLIDCWKGVGLFRLRAQLVDSFPGI
jgi:hypothetical protein